MWIRKALPRLYPFVSNSGHMTYVSGTYDDLTVSPVAAFTRGGPARNTVPFFLTMILSSAMAGIYAPPAVQLPITTDICAMPCADIFA